MKFDHVKILQSKREFRQNLSALPIEENLTMLNILHEHTLAIRPTGPMSEADALRE